MGKAVHASGASGNGSAGATRIVYILERFPADTLNFVYNEIDVLERHGCSIEIFSLLPSIFCPVDAQKYLPRTKSIKPVGVHRLTLALFYYLFRRPARLLSLLTIFPFDNKVGFWAKWPRTLSHVIYGIYFAYLLRDRTVHVHAHFAHKAATAAYCAARLNGSSFSFTAHGSAAIHPPSTYSLPSKIREARFVVAISEFNRRKMLELCPDVPPERIVVNRTGIVVENFPFRNARRNDSAIPKVLCLASLYPIKNHEGLLDACGRLKSSGTAFHLDLVGKDDGGRWPELQNRAKALGIADCVTFHGVADHSTVAARLQEADLLVLASHSEGIPVAMMEAMATGTPVLGPRVTGVPELVDEGQSGWLADPASPDEFADVMARVLADRALLESVQTPARKKIEAEFDMSANAEQLARVFEDRIGKLA